MGGVAGRDDGVEVFRAEPKLREADDIVGTGLCGVGEHGDLAPVFTETAQRLGGVRVSDGAIMQRALDAGLMLSVTADTVVRLLPPLIITQAECDELISILVPLIKTFLAEKA